ncbi:MAG: hypothetical protein ACI8ZF_000508 [Candidatus Midichloriaceae bacterium]
MKNFIIIVNIVSIIVGVVWLFSIKSKVTEQGRKLDWLKSQISQELENITILKSEFAYLTAPSRIYKLQKLYLNLEVAKKCQKSSEYE